MKKKFALVLAVLLILSMGLSACGGSPENDAQNYNLVLATGGTSGTYYPYGGAMANIWNTTIEGMNVVAQSTGASNENLKLVANGDADLAIVQNDSMFYAFEGTGIDAFEGKPLSGFSAICTLYPEVVQIVVRPDKGIESVADLRGRTISIGDAGSGVEANALQILAAYGLSLSDVDAKNLSFKESGSSYQDKQLDAFFVTAGVPNSAIQEITATSTVNILSITGAELASLLDNYEFYTEYSIPQETYAGMAGNATTLSVKASLIVSNSLDEEVVYQLTKSLFENLEDFQAAHNKAMDLSLESAVDGVSIPFHPGAVRYFEEVGAL
jgi:hypothetical protein